MLKTIIGVQANIYPTEFTMILTDEEYKLVERIAAASAATSHGLCDSFMFIKETTPIPQKGQQLK